MKDGHESQLFRDKNKKYYHRLLPIPKIEGAMKIESLARQ